MRFLAVLLSLKRHSDNGLRIHRVEWAWHADLYLLTYRSCLRYDYDVLHADVNWLGRAYSVRSKQKQKQLIDRPRLR